MKVVALTPKSRTYDDVKPEFDRACRDLRAALAAATSPREAFPIYRHVQAMSAELLRLTDEAAARCEDLLRMK